MSQQGWVKVHRQLKESWIYEDKPYDRTHAWIDLLLRANHQDKKVALGTELIEVKRGSFITSEIKLMEAWGWSKTKLRSYLKMLQNDGMIEKITDKKKTTINIVNYSVYQDTENQEKTTEEPQENHEETTKEPRKDTNKNEKNEKNDKELKNNIRELSLKNQIIDNYTSNEDLKNALYEFVKMRKTIKAAITDTALKLALGKLDKLSNDDLEKIEILNQSIFNSWKGLFELKPGNQSKKGGIYGQPRDNPYSNIDFEKKPADWDDGEEIDLTGLI